MDEKTPLRSLIYVSSAKSGLGSDDLDNIHYVGLKLNTLDGTTGVLLYNGPHFLQLIEGYPEGIEDLLGRLRNDRRHSDVEVVSDATVAAASFPDWTMSLIRISVGRFEAHKNISDCLPDKVPKAVRERLKAAADLISA